MVLYPEKINFGMMIIKCMENTEHLTMLQSDPKVVQTRCYILLFYSPSGTKIFGDDDEHNMTCPFVVTPMHCSYHIC
jgi:hypothetical protein